MGPPCPPPLDPPLLHWQKPSIAIEVHVPRTFKFRNLFKRAFKIYGMWSVGRSVCRIHTHLRNAVPPVWGSLRLAPIIYVYICRTSFRKCKFTLLTRNIAHAEFKCGRNIEKNTWSKY